LAAVVMTMQACGRKSAPEGAEAAQSLLTAIWAGDARAFEASLDRPAIRADLRQQLTGLARANALDVQGGASDAALDRMIGTAAIRLVQSGTGAPLTAAPSLAQAAALMKPLGKNRACLHGQAPDQCLLIFARQNGEWKLVGMPMTGAVIPIAPEPRTEGT
jgi:hypothetical protein